MALNFDNIPADKPNAQSKIEPGRYNAVVFKAEMRTGKTSGNEYLNVSFKLDKGGFVNESFVDKADSTFCMYKIGRLLKACNVTLEGDFTLNDIRKVIAGKHLIIDATVNDRGYGMLDFSGENQGMYPIEETEAKDSKLDADVDAAIEDEDF